MTNDNNISLEIELLKKAMDLDADSNLIDVANKLIAIHFESHKDCNYVLSDKKRVVTSTMPLATGEEEEHVHTLPPHITVTRTVTTHVTD